MSEHGRRWVLGLMVGLTLGACALDIAPQAGAPCADGTADGTLRCTGDGAQIEVCSSGRWEIARQCADPAPRCVASSAGVRCSGEEGGGLDSGAADATTPDAPEDAAALDVAQDAEDAAPDVAQEDDASDDASLPEDAAPDACVEQTCESLRASCGVIDNGCGVTIPCGVCSSEEGCTLESSLERRCTPCPTGLSNNGADTCAPPGSCAPGFHDDGDGRCVTGDTCAEGLLFQGQRCIGSRAAPELPDARAFLNAVQLQDGRILAAGGSKGALLNLTGNANRNVWSYTPGAQDAWTSLTSMRGAQTHLNMQVLPSGHVLVTGGYNDAEVYDPLLNAWFLVPNHPNNELSAAVEREEGSLVFFGSGRTPHRWSGLTAEVMTPLGMTSIATFNPIRATHHPTLPLTLLHGQRYNDNDNPSPLLQLWSHETQLPIELPARGDEAVEGVVTAREGTLWMIGGRVLGGLTSSASCDRLVSTGASWGWAPCPTLPEPRSYHSVAASPDGAIAVFGGTLDITTEASDNVWVLEPGAEAWAAHPPLLQARYGAAVVPIGPRRALLIGGRAAHDPFDPASATLRHVEIVDW